MTQPAPRRAPTHLAAVLFALLITFLWSTSWVLIKWGMNQSLPALTFAGLRYTLAWLSLSPLALFRSRQRAEFRTLPHDNLALTGLQMQLADIQFEWMESGTDIS